MKILNLKNNYVGIDLGTTNILVTIKDKGIVLNEPSVIAIDKKNGEVLAIGKEAKEMIGRNPVEIDVIRPVQGGVIADYLATELLIKHIFKKICKKYLIKKPRVIVGIPSGITEVEERAVQEVLLQAGAREVYLIEEPMAAAIGANLQVSEPTGSIIVDIGGGTTEVSVISLGGVVVSNSIKVAGDALDEAIINYVKRELNVTIGKNTAERIKKEIGSAVPTDENKKMKACGRDILNGLPRTIELNVHQIYCALEEPISEIIECIKVTLEKTPPELASDLGEKGVYLAGGGALISNLDKLISYKTNMPVYVAEDALDCVVKGTAKTFENFEVLKTVLVSSKK